MLFNQQVMLAICPDFIPPRFDKYSSLQESDLKTKIDKLAAEFNLPLKRLYVPHGLKFEMKQNNAMTQKNTKNRLKAFNINSINAQ